MTLECQASRCERRMKSSEIFSKGAEETPCQRPAIASKILQRPSLEVSSSTASRPLDAGPVGAFRSSDLAAANALRLRFLAVTLRPIWAPSLLLYLLRKCSEDHPLVAGREKVPQQQLGVGLSFR